MDFKTLDRIADLCIPLLIVSLLLAAFAIRRGAAWIFLLRSAIAVALAQQICKLCQKNEVLGGDFPSTHFAVALALLTCFVVLKQRLWPLALGFATLYGALMLAQRYHTPLEMLGAVFAVPLALLLHWQRRTAEVGRSLVK
ncbi:MAG TPA: hypothetical protein VF627_03560 [Abditibacterium sp.]|jgi:hypothetical protein